MTVVYLTHPGCTLAVRSQSLVVRGDGVPQVRVPSVGV
jgi:hypothetical protein